jgi:alpha-glucosidase (family GH31 glycosyl hydrolase)
MHSVCCILYPLIVVTTYSRRELLKGMCALPAVVLSQTRSGSTSRNADSAPVEIQVTPVSRHTFRLSVLPIRKGTPVPVPFDGSLLRSSWGAPITALRGKVASRKIVCGDLLVQVSAPPVKLRIANSTNDLIQELSFSEDGGLSFLTGDTPLLGLGEGGPQFDRRGSIDKMISGQGGYRLHTHGGRVPIPWLIGTSGWAMYIHQPFGTFDFTGTQGKFQPNEAGLPLDIFFVAASEPATIISEYANLTGHPEMPPLWSFGYQQSHRTLASKGDILAEAKMFREKRLPCDTMIYLGTGFCPSGWNTQNGSFVWNSKVFPDPKEMIRDLHHENFKVVLHSVILSDKLHGSVHEPCDVTRFDDERASCHWDAHRRDFAMGVDGWWPDEGDPLDISSRLVRNRLYWEGPQLDRPNERPFALHRNGYAGMQRYASFLWSGDVYSTWETLKAQVPIAINTSLTGIPFWGTDIGGFVPTKEFTAELYLRWFQFGAFCTLFRCHGRAWKLRLPWQWNSGEPGPAEINNYDGAALPDSAQLHNPDVEPICRKYLELRYRLLPYLYSAVRECTQSGIPVMRALWLHYPDDPKAVACGDQYLWGKNILVAPVLEKGATSRRVYLPHGDWFDFWSGEKIKGGGEIVRPVDLETIPLFLRAGSLLPLGPIKQFTGEKVDQPLSVTIYPGNDAAFLLYEDDGVSFNYRKGEWMGIEMKWEDAPRILSLRLASGSKMLAPMRRSIEIKLANAVRTLVFDGHAVSAKL